EALAERTTNRRRDDRSARPRSLAVRPERAVSYTTHDRGAGRTAVWSPDGSRIAFVASSRGSYSLFWMRADGGGTPQRVTEGGEFPGQWLPDGRSLVFAKNGDIGMLSVDDPQHAQMLVSTRFYERIPDLSPDGHWLA